MLALASRIQKATSSTRINPPVLDIKDSKRSTLFILHAVGPHLILCWARSLQRFQCRHIRGNAASQIVRDIIKSHQLKRTQVPASAVLVWFESRVLAFVRSNTRRSFCRTVPPTDLLSKGPVIDSATLEDISDGKRPYKTTSNCILLIKAGVESSRVTRTQAHLPPGPQSERLIRNECFSAFYFVHHPSTFIPEFLINHVFFF